MGINTGAWQTERKEIESDSRNVARNVYFLARKNKFFVAGGRFMKFRFLILALFCAAVFGLPQTVFGQKPGGQTELSTGQRLDVMSSKLDTMRRS
ncbi:MAG TPA: hypothetical protein VJS13_06375, partial [Pyrinomonadaceae bacterium]|nr:hypothetical protein [Pyrinomonadaceae bacterium]